MKAGCKSLANEGEEPCNDPLAALVTQQSGVTAELGVRRSPGGAGGSNQFDGH